MGAIRAHDWLVHVRVDVSSGVLLRGRVDVVGVGGWSFSYIAFARLPSQGKVTPTPPPTWD